MKRVSWYIKQILPLSYESSGYAVTDGQYYHVRWRMWLGHVFAQRWTWFPAA